MKSFETHKVAPDHSGYTLEQYLKQVLHYSGRKIQKLTRQKGITLNGKTVFLQKKVKPNDSIRVLILEDASYGVQPEPGAVEILYEDENMLVLNKPAFQLVHPTGQTSSGTLANFLAFHLQQRGIISTIRPLHRLDRDTSGCVIFAKDSRSQFILEQQLKEGTLERTYWALVQGAVQPPSGTIDAPIGPHPAKPNRRMVTPGGEPAVTHYQTLRTFSNFTLLQLTLDTGRTHQIRVHLAHLGYPLIGDGMYGVRTPWMNRQALHASSVRIRSIKDNQEITVTAPIPSDIIHALEVCEQ